jgi:hypothetical protein
MPEHSRRPSPSSQACCAWRSGSAIGVCAKNSISTTRSSTPTCRYWIPRFHAYERNHPGRPWTDTLYGSPEVAGDQMVAAMDVLGVDGAILASPSACIATTGQLHQLSCGSPQPVQLVKPADPTDPAINRVPWVKRLPGSIGAAVAPGQRAHPPRRTDVTRAETSTAIPVLRH